MFTEYFPNAQVWAMDVSWNMYNRWRYPKSKDSKRLHLLTCCRDEAALHQYGLARDSMDLVLEDAGEHRFELQKMLFQ